MNHQPTYEQLIADKLQELPVPDMADAIWARIEQQLDVEMPVNDPGPSDHGGGSPLPGFRFPGTLLSLFIIAFISVFFFFNNRNETQDVVMPVDTDQQTASPQPVPVLNTGKIQEQGTASTRKNEQQVPVEVADDGEQTETSSLTEPPPLLIPEPAKEKQTMDHLRSPLIMPEVKKEETIPPPDSTVKKGRGVKGINPNDYKIAPVKKPGNGN